VLLKYHSWASMRVSYPAVTVFGDAFQTSSDTHLFGQRCTAAHPDWTYNPAGATPAGLTHPRFRLLPVRSPLLREYFLFLGVHEMFQFPRCPPTQMRGSSCHHDGVAPFGDRGINACSRLPHAYRSYATSFIGTQRRGIHPLLILSSLKEDLVWTILDRLFAQSAYTDHAHVVDSVDHMVSHDQQC
jgi:hypothetical protein